MFVEFNFILFNNTNKPNNLSRSFNLKLTDDLVKLREENILKTKNNQMSQNVNFKLHNEPIMMKIDHIETNIISEISPCK
jgi:hypothetical protein